MKLNFWIALTLVTLGSVEVAECKSVSVKLRVFSRANPEVGVPATIFRKKPAIAIEEMGTTDGNGEITVFDTDCSPTTSYRAMSTQQAIFPDGPAVWTPCTLDRPIEISIASTGLSSITEAFLNNKAPTDWKIPRSYEGAIAELLAAQAAEQWGVSAKIGSQLAYQFNAAGLDQQAKVFGEISIASTGIYAMKESSAALTIKTILEASDGVKGVKLTPESRKLIAALQESCGTEPDGIVGWTTMNCLPGGKGYKLPSQILVPISSGSTGGGF
jgi:hypothetical protein